MDDDLKTIIFVIQPNGLFLSPTHNVAALKDVIGNFSFSVKDTSEEISVQDAEAAGTKKTKLEFEEKVTAANNRTNNTGYYDTSAAEMKWDSMFVDTGASNSSTAEISPA